MSLKDNEYLLENLSLFKNLKEIQAFAKGYFLAIPDGNKYQEENDEWCAFSEEIDINFYTIDGTMHAFAYKVIDGETLTDDNSYELVYAEDIPKNKIKK